MKKSAVILSIFLVLLSCTTIKKEELTGEWDLVYSNFYNIATKDEEVYSPPDILGDITFEEKGWAVDVKREDGYQVKGGGIYQIRSNRVILNFFQGGSWIAIMEDDTLKLNIKPSPPSDPAGILLKFYKNE